MVLVWGESHRMLETKRNQTNANEGVWWYRLGSHPTVLCSTDSPVSIASCRSAYSTRYRVLYYYYWMVSYGYGTLETLQNTFSFLACTVHCTVL